MKLNKIDNTFTFKSNILPCKELDNAFDAAYNSKDREFLNAVKAILNDGKNRNISFDVSIQNGKYDMTRMLISDRNGGYWASSAKENPLLARDHVINNDIINIIKRFAQKELSLTKSNEVLTGNEIRNGIKGLKKIIFG